VGGPSASPIPGSVEFQDAQALAAISNEIKPFSTTKTGAADLTFIDAVAPFRALARDKPLSIILLGTHLPRVFLYFLHKFRATA
jgi:hypothetical protein